MQSQMTFFEKQFCAIFYLYKIVKKFCHKQLGQHCMTIIIQQLLVFQIYITLLSFLQMNLLSMIN